MRNISSAFRRALANDKRDYQNRVRFTLADNTVFDVRNDQLWDDGLHIDDAVSNDNSFQIGAAIINQCKLVLNNIYHDFSEYNFDGAKIVVYTGLNDLDDGTDEEIKLGTYEVDDTSYNGSLITLTCLDNMSKFDKAYETNLQFPATLYQMVTDACSKCGVTLDTSSLNFPHKDYIVSEKPSGDNTTFRQIISWTAQIACCFARCNVDGNLEFRWFNTDEFDNFTTGIDGGVFDGHNIEWLSSYMNTDTGMTVLSNTRVDNDWFRINNSIGFEFNGSAMDYLYIASNSRFKFSNSTSKPGSSKSTNHDVNICGRDGQSVSVKYQTINDSSRKAIKVRFHGYTRYQTSYQTRAYELEYEIFFADNGAIVVNFITIPTATGYLGTTSIKENNVSSSFSPTTDEVVALYRGSGDTWTTDPTEQESYVSGDDADGGTFSPWNDGDEYEGGNFDDFSDLHFIQSSYSSHISTDNVVITGVKVIKKIAVDGGSNVFEEYTSGASGYVIVIENNDLIEGIHGQDVADWVGAVVNGVQFRKATITHPSDPSIEAGDVAIYFDENGNSYPILVSSTTFTPGNSQITASSAETPKKNSSQRFTQATRDYVEIRQRLTKQKTEWEEAAEDLSDRIDNASGLYCTEVVEQGATKTYYHNKPVLEESDIIMLFSTVGFTMSADGGTTWYGMTVDGQMIASILNAIGVNADWINSGAISIKDANDNETFYADTATGAVRIKASTFSLQGETIEQIAKDSAPHNWYQSTNPANNWTDDETRAKHVGDQWYCPSGADVIPSWLTAHLNTEDNMTVLSSTYVDDSWFSITNDVGFEFEGAASAYIYISSNSRFSFSDISGLSNPSTKIEIYGRDGSSVGIRHQTIVSGSNQAIKIRFKGYTRYGTANQKPEYAIEYEIFFTNDNKIYLNLISTPTNESYFGTTRVIDNGTSYYPSDRLLSGEHVAIIKTTGWTYDIPGRYANKTWQYVYRNSTYTWLEKLALGSQLDVFNALTNNGTAQGVYLEGGQLYILFSYAKGGTLALGGVNNDNGVLEMFDSSGNRVGRWDNTGLYLGNVASDLTAPNTSISTGGAIATKSLTANDYVYVDGNTQSYLNIPMGNTNAYTRVESGGFSVKDQWGNVMSLNSSNYNARGFKVRPSNASATAIQEGTTLDGNSLYIMKVGGTATVSISSDTISLVGANQTFPNFLAYTNGYNQYSGIGVRVTGSFNVDGEKHRIVNTEDYSVRALSCYETPIPMFGDVGEGIIGDDGLCYVSLDPIFLETISKDCAYQVFLQKYGEGECYVSERKSTYFVVTGEPNLSFAWEIKAKQVDFDQERLPIIYDPIIKEPGEEEELDYGTRAMIHIRSIMEERSLDNA